MGRVTVRRPVLRLSEDGGRRREDTLAAEEPLELRVGGRRLTILMRTPGRDVELVHGFLLAHGVLTAAADLSTARYCAGVDEQGANTYNVLDVALAPGVEPPGEREVCGRSALDAVRPSTRFSPADDACVVAPKTLAGLPELLRPSTGGLHAAGLFTAAGEQLVVREDVGRHNAVDKVLGWALMRHQVPLAGTVLVVSGRVSCALAAKAVAAGVPVLASVSAPSALAVELAREQGVTLIGYLRGSTMNVYTRADRLSGS
jgi:FdhD protein